MEQFDAKAYRRRVNERAPAQPDGAALPAGILDGRVDLLHRAGDCRSAAYFFVMTTEEVSAWTAIVLVFLAALLTGLGVYDRIGNYAGAGSVVPITGFSNSMVAPAIEFRQEGYVLGVGRQDVFHRRAGARVRHQHVRAGGTPVAAVLSGKAVRMENKRRGKRTLLFPGAPWVRAAASIVSSKEGDGPIGRLFDVVLEDDTWGEDSFERAECRMFEEAVRLALKKCGMQPEELGCLLGGDLLNQIITANYAARSLKTPFLGLYGACSTMAESLLLGSVLVDGGFAESAACVASSHFSTAERQYRFPLEMGDDRAGDGAADGDRRRLRRAVPRKCGQCAVWPCARACGDDRPGGRPRHYRRQQHGRGHGACRVRHDRDASQGSCAHGGGL